MSVVVIAMITTGVAAASESGTSGELSLATVGTFTDVADGAFYSDAVHWAQGADITTGTSATTFEPDRTLVRKEGSTLIWRAAGSPMGSPDSGFTDVPSGAYYEEAVNWMKDQGITTGVSSSTFDPDGALTRAMGVTLLWREDGSSVFQMNIFHINDHHSHLQPDDIDLTVGTGGDEVELALGGFPRVVSAIESLRADNAGEYNVTVHAGDAVTGTLFYTLFAGEADADLMNQACFDVFALGNHEFDAGDAGLVTFLDFLNSDATCETDVVAANVGPALGTPLFPDPTTQYIMPYSIQEFGDESVAFIGLDIAQKTQVSSSPLDSTVFLDEVATAQTVIDDLTAQGYDKIGLVTHYTYANDLALISMVSGVDFVVGGDSHTLLGDYPALGLTGVGPYPTVASNLGGDTTCLVQAWQYSTVVGELNVEFDANGEVTGCGGDAHILLGEVLDFDDDGNTVEPSQADVDAALAAAGLMTYTPHAASQTILDGYAVEVDVLAAEVIGAAADDLCIARFPLDGSRSAICEDIDVPNGGDIQQSVTDGFLERAFRADIALQNSGGVRIDIPAGDITIADAYTLLPFANTLLELDMTGAEIVLALEQGLGNVLDAGGSSGAYPYGSGIRWDVDLNEPFGSRFSSIEVKPKGTGTWVAIDLGATYVVVANSFMATGGDGYEVLADVVADGRSVDTFLDYAQSFIDWIIEDLGGILTKPTDYSTVTFTDFTV